MYDFDWARVEKFFPRAMRQVGYFSYNPQSIVATMFGKRCEWCEGDLRLVDEWTEMPDTRLSFGQTTIEHLIDFRWIPIWRMAYGGFYSKEVTSFLKTTMVISYDQWEMLPFQCCRGPEEEWYNNKYVYQNLHDPDFGEQSFRRFASLERILHYPDGSRGKAKSVIAGYHSIFGMALM